MDDEKDIREILSETIDESPRMQKIGEASSVLTAFDEIITKKPELIFLDIKLQGGDAFMIIDKLISVNYKIPPIVLNTGFNEFELAQKSLNEYGKYIIKILQKPFWKDWALKESEIISVLDERLKQLNVARLPLQDVLSLKDGSTVHMVNINDILYLTKDGTKKSSKVLNVVTKEKTVKCRESLIHMSENLNSNFVQISRFSIINLRAISSFNFPDSLIYMRDSKNTKLIIGRSYKSKLMEDFRKLGIV